MKQRRFRLLGALWALVFLWPRLPDAALSNVSSQTIFSTSVPSGRITMQKFRCDNSGSIDGTGPVGGETCATGSWWPAVDATGARLVSLSGREYGTGAAQLGLFNCIVPAGVGTIPGVNNPGVDDPNQAPTPTVPSPLCTRINVDAAGAAVPVTGMATQEVHWANRNFDFLVVRIDSCTGFCDLSGQLKVTW